MLNEPDKELEGREHKFVRYADDLLILCRSKRSTKRTMSSMIHFIEDKLFLKKENKKEELNQVPLFKFFYLVTFPRRKEALLSLYEANIQNVG